MCTQPQATKPAHTNKGETIFTKNGYSTYHTQKLAILLKCDNEIENIQKHMSSQVFFFWFEFFNKCEKYI
jgi:hypothetical protein